MRNYDAFEQMQDQRFLWARETFGSTLTPTRSEHVFCTHVCYWLQAAYRARKVPRLIAPEQSEIVKAEKELVNMKVRLAEMKEVR